MRAKKLYDVNFLKWGRKKYTCLSDFTARKFIFSLIKNLKNKTVADLGCGEGFCCRYFLKKGAKKVYGIDISKKMINLAKKISSPKIIFKNENIENTKIKTNFADISFAIFVFNYLKKKQILKACKELKRITKKNGLVYITVPHPFYPLISGKNKIFYFNRLNKYDYISKTDKVLDGYITKLDKSKLPVKLIHHTFQDYFDVFQKVNFTKIIMFKELRVEDEELKKNPAFFRHVKNLPLHILFIIQV
tara:strand:+ start:1555 stop:2295 length:741 start_codon:yes stop_codon:yes gene_type:complete